MQFLMDMYSGNLHRFDPTNIPIFGTSAAKSEKSSQRKFVSVFNQFGKHEHVFFDKSIMRRSIDDLQKDFRIGETLHFNAILAPKTSRAKWKATQVLREYKSFQEFVIVLQYTGLCEDIQLSCNYLSGNLHSLYYLMIYVVLQ